MVISILGKYGEHRWMWTDGGDDYRYDDLQIPKNARVYRSHGQNVYYFTRNGLRWKVILYRDRGYNCFCRKE